MRKAALAGMISTLLVAPAYAWEAFKIKDIRVEGIQRTEAGTVFSYLPVKVGDTMTDESASQAVKALFATGFFKDVRLEVEGQVLVVVVDERPAIASLKFDGLKAFKTEDLTKGLKEVGLAEARIFDRSMVERAEQELKRQYLSQGYYAVDLKTTVTPLERNRVGISFTVVEGEVARIKQINIIGSKAFSESDLLDQFTLRTPGWLTWYTGNDKYSKQKLSGDLEKMRSYYLDRGYLEFNIESTQVSISQDKQDIYITINMTEGEQYTVSSLKLTGDLILPESVLTPLVKVKPGEVFSREAMTDTTKAITDRLGNEGYAFANVNSAPEVDREKRQVAFTVVLDPGRRVYVRRINIAGNTKTRDEVIRREIRQLESSWYDGERINKSKERIDRLGYFEDITVETPAVAGTIDQVDVDVKLKEKPTGNLLIGAGFSSAEGLVLSGSINQQNLFGSGKHLGFQLSTSKSNQVYSISHTDPYWSPDGISRGFDIYTRKTDTSSLNTGTFGSDSIGGGVRFGFPIADDEGMHLGLSIDKTSLSLNIFSPIRYINYVNTFGADSTTYLATLGWTRDDRDSFNYPTKGTLQRAVIELATPGSTATYYRATYQYQKYFPFAKRWSLMLNGELGGAQGYGGKELPFFKNFYAGGIGSVRGYESGSLGPRDPTTAEYLGGNFRVIANAELFMPTPGAGTDRSFRISAFVDAGNVFGYGDAFKPGNLRYSTGLGLSWNSPMGPLRFALAKPLNTQSTDKLQRFQFQLGNSF
ncbi:MAG: outer membrane protein assembly factor BamA [Rhodocyclaceae bacterium]|nr:outer membrane protein assembly factor BamA [Rhodocyclaceae bacterium]MBK9624550.1 outer membrane protein assembly factor BamA [Rhodocyclaceae bacterium]MBL0075886.1 outer membrane protein assembly factor BamA [Rhodocyclaceae bacterium]MBP6110141.1 outer membrane protein assembly factor BamA [Rhodocyclaceae bacterium]MBP6279310.1 outer membrane protein assembly factor BamA [Rhodocyclaceae bacterium]